MWMLRYVKGQPYADLVIDAPNRQYAIEEGLCTAAIMSLGSNRRAPNNLRDQRGLRFDDPQGWVGDIFDDEPEGSLLWTLLRRKATPGVEGLARSYARQALSWMLRDGIARDIEISSRRVTQIKDAQGRVLQKSSAAIVLDIVILRPDEVSPRLVIAWNVTLGEPCEQIDPKIAA